MRCKDSQLKRNYPLLPKLFLSGFISETMLRTSFLSTLEYKPNCRPGNVSSALFCILLLIFESFFFFFMPYSYLVRLFTNIVTHGESLKCSLLTGKKRVANDWQLFFIIRKFLNSRPLFLTVLQLCNKGCDKPNTSKRKHASSINQRYRLTINTPVVHILIQVSGNCRSANYKNL